MSANFEILESTPNVKLVRDGQGRSWLCDAGAVAEKDLHGQGCVLESEIIYDRNFGG
jgi:hypothetical protein